MSACNAVEEVYNIEVDGDHVYRVGELGLLVHNQSSPPKPSSCVCPKAKPDSANVPGTGKAGPFKVSYRVNMDEETRIKASQQAVCKVKIISGVIKPEDRPTTQTPEQAMRGLLLGKAKDFKKYDAGHLIAATLGGPHRTENLVPMTKKFNREGGWRSFEDRVKKCLLSKCIVKGHMTVSVTYGNTNRFRYIPTKLNVKVKFTPKKGKAGGPSLSFQSDGASDSKNFRGKDCLKQW